MQKLKEELEEYLGAYYEDAPEEAEYPYKVFLLKRISQDDERQRLILEINVWDQHKYYSRAESMMDSIEKKLNGCIRLSDDTLYYCYNGNREPIKDPDKSIKRIREQFELYCYERS